MAWIESHQSLGRHPKVIRLASKLRVHKAQAIGHLQYLWWWALDFAPTGNLSAFTPAEISAGAEWPGQPGPFHVALSESGWLDPDGSIHDWHEYAGRLIEKRATDRDRKRVHRMSDGNPMDGARTALVPTQPTQPTNQTNSLSPRGDAGFLKWWKEWPSHERKKGKEKCARHWEKKGLEKIAEKVIGCLRRCRRSEQWAKKNGEFIPLPMSWLNDTPWETEPGEMVGAAPEPAEGEFVRVFTTELVELAYPSEPETGVKS